MMNITKDQIISALLYFGEPFKESERKTVLEARLSSFMKRFPEVWLNMMLESDLRLIKRLCDLGKNSSVRMEEPDLTSVAENLGIITTYAAGEYDMVFELGEGIYEIVKPYIGKVISQREKDGSFLIEQTVMGILNIYGAIPLRSFIDILFEQSGIFASMATDELSYRVADCPLVKMHQQYYKGTIYLVSPFVENFQEIMSMRRMSFKEIKKYGKTTLSEAIAAGKDTPWCAYGLDTPEGKNLIAMLRSIGYEGEALSATVHEIWRNSQYALDEEATSALFGPVSDKQDDMRSFEIYRECISIVSDYANSVPKWLLKGNRPKDVNLMKIAIKVTDLESEFENDKDMLMYRLGLAVRPVHSDDLCPCGSGLRYCNCHGRYLN